MASKKIRYKTITNFSPKNIQGQVSMEYIMMVAVALLTIVPVVYIFYSYSKSSTNDIMFNRVTSIGRNIVYQSESIYYLGEPSRVTLEETMPEGVETLDILTSSEDNIYELVFTLVNNNTIVISSKVPIDGNFDNSSYSAGIKNILIESKGSYVNISIN